MEKKKEKKKKIDFYIDIALMIQNCSWRFSRDITYPQEQDGYESEGRKTSESENRVKMPPKVKGQVLGKRSRSQNLGPGTSFRWETWANARLSLLLARKTRHCPCHTMVQVLPTWYFDDWSFHISTQCSTEDVLLLCPGSLWVWSHFHGIVHFWGSHKNFYLPRKTTYYAVTPN